MIAAIVCAYVVIGVVSVPLIISHLNRHGEGLVRDPAMEALVGAAAGPVPLLMFVAYFILRTVGRAAWWITRTHDLPEVGTNQCQNAVHAAPIQKGSSNEPNT